MPYVENNENPEICRKCDRKCCQRVSGAYHPDDFHLDHIEEEIESLIQQHKLALNVICDDWNTVYFPRPVMLSTERFVECTFGGTCIYLTDHGCELPFEKRPYECRILIPNKNLKKQCKTLVPYGRDEVMEVWKPYQKFFSKMRKRYSHLRY